MSDAVEANRHDTLENRGLPIAVVKLGGSVLTGANAYRQAAAFLAGRLAERPSERLVVVVSAERGTTDELLRQARNIAPEPDSRLLDLLWSTGETRSVAMLGLALQARGIRAAGLNVREAGLRAGAEGDGLLRLRALRIRSLLADHAVVVLPGFFATGEGNSIVSLGRGGSDLSAVLLAVGLGADRCELIKDVDGYFHNDPRLEPGARHLPVIDSTTALDMADDGCELVQKRALIAARRHGVLIVVRSWDSRRATLLHHDGVPLHTDTRCAAEPV